MSPTKGHPSFSFSAINPSYQADLQHRCHRDPVQSALLREVLPVAVCGFKDTLTDF